MAIPEDLEREILLRLPVKSLLRFKCVRKNWYSLIKNHNFIKQNLNCNKNKEPQLLIYDYGTHDDDDFSPITLINSDGTNTVAPSQENIEYFRRFKGMSRLIGSVDGLFLLERESDDNIISVALWNPANRELRPLPAAQFDGLPNSWFKHFGLGLDPLNNDYKVVCFQLFRDEDLHSSLACITAAVYSCSRDSWRIFSPKNYKIPTDTRSYDAYGTAYLNGAYYWLLFPYKCTILSFDFSNEVFREIEGPDRLNHAILILLDDSIALLTLVDRADYDIWVMIQPGVWNKLLTFECFPYFLSWYCNTAILASRYCRLISYNVRTKETRHFGFRHLGLKQLRGVCSVYCYKESLVTVK